VDSETGGGDDGGGGESGGFVVVVGCHFYVWVEESVLVLIFELGVVVVVWVLLVGGEGRIDCQGEEICIGSVSAKRRHVSVK
jgi:hypothetical protein